MKVLPDHSEAEESHPEAQHSHLLKQAGNRTIFTVPDTYFLTLGARIQKAIKKSDQELDLFCSEKAGAEIPGASEMNISVAGNEIYFAGLQQRIAEKIAAAENLRFIPELPQTHPFIVPENYFKELPVIILGLVKSLKERTDKPFQTRVFKTGNLKRILTYPRIAAAASIIFLGTFAGIRFKSIINMNHEYAQSATEERFNYRYDIDESLVEDELIGTAGNQQQGAGAANSNESDTSTSEKYLLEHIDINTLIEEI